MVSTLSMHLYHCLSNMTARLSLLSPHGMIFGKEQWNQHIQAGGQSLFVSRVQLFDHPGQNLDPALAALLKDIVSFLGGSNALNALIVRVFDAFHKTFPFQVFDQPGDGDYR